MHKLEDSFTNRSCENVRSVLGEGDPLEGLEGKILQAVHAFCIYNGKLVLVYAPSKGRWMPPGGGIETGETYKQAVTRKVFEETNMRVLKQELLGYIDIYEPTRIVRQTRSLCSVEPIGPFIADPDGEISEIKLIDPTKYKKDFDWGTIGDYFMSRVIEEAES